MESQDKGRRLSTAMLPGVVGLILALGMLWFGRDLNYGSLTEPRAGTYPLVIAIVFLLLSVYAIFAEYVHPRSEWLGLGKHFRKLVGVGLGLLAFIVLFHTVGYTIANIALCVISMKTLGSRGWLPIIIFSVVLSLACYFIFTSLGTVLPNGPLPF